MYNGGSSEMTKKIFATKLNSLVLWYCNLPICDAGDGTHIVNGKNDD